MTTSTGHDHEGRLARLRPVLAAAGVDALLVTSLVNVRYLTGFSGSNAALLVPTGPEDDALLATDARYVTQAAAEAPGIPLLEARDCLPAVASQVAGSGLAVLGFESSHLSVADHDRLRQAAPGVRPVGVLDTVEGLRAVKDAHELSLLTSACAISSAAIEQLLDEQDWTGRTEREVAGALEHRMRQLGADAAAFETIVGSGPHAAIPHHQPGGRVLARGDLLVVDFGARVEGYHADMTRTFVLGPPAAWQQEIFDVVRTAQAAGTAALRPGAACADVDAAARGVIADAGFGARFGHGTGHGVGLEIHEAPGLGPLATGTLAAAVPVTVEPGVYLPDRGGVRIEDTLVVDDSGASSLTTTSRELRALG